MGRLQCQIWRGSVCRDGSDVDCGYGFPSTAGSGRGVKAESGVPGLWLYHQADSFYDAIINWVDRHYHWKVQKDWIVFTPGVIPGYTIVIQSFTEPGDGIIVQTPVYYPFMDGVNNNGRKLVLNPLKEENGHWTMDFEDLEAKVKDPANKLLILSNPHNPVGRAWTKEELEKLGNLCADNNVLLISDEIHADLMMGGHKHQAVCALSEKNPSEHHYPLRTEQDL